MTTLEAPLVEAAHGQAEQRFAEVLQTATTLGVVPDTLVDAADGVYLAADTVTDEGGAEAPRFVGVEFTPGARLGAADSQHEVTFGTLSVEANEQLSQVAVAIKPFQGDTELAVHEYTALQAAQQRGLDTYRPLGVVKDGETAYLVTEYRPEIETLDNHDWTVPYADTQRYEAVVRPNLHFVANTMASMHTKGVFHGDAQPKNFAMSDTGSSVVVDLEDAAIAASSEEAASLLARGDDLVQFWYTATHPSGVEDANIMLQDASYEDCMAEFEEHFLAPYIEAVQAQADAELLTVLDLEAVRADLAARVARMP